MSASFGGDGSSQEVDINITPIIDCFTVLITFLLASASFLSIGFFEVATPGTASSPDTQEPNTEALIRIRKNESLVFTLKGKKQMSLSLQLKDPKSIERIKSEINAFGDQKLNVSQVLISADDETQYEAITTVMTAVQDTPVPAVLGEF